MDKHYSRMARLEVARVLLGGISGTMLDENHGINVYCCNNHFNFLSAYEKKQHITNVA
jgi:hypothetical protein